MKLVIAILVFAIFSQGCIDSSGNKSKQDFGSESDSGNLNDNDELNNDDDPDPRSLPRLMDINQINGKYIGAFRVSGEYVSARIAFNPNGNDGRGSLFISTKLLEFGVKEVAIPEFDADAINKSLEELAYASTLQQGVNLLDKIPLKSWSSEPIENRIMSLHYHQGRLFVNGAIYYDGGGTDRDTTFRIETPEDLENSLVTGNFKVEGAQHTTKWTSPIPPVWQSLFGEKYLMGAGPELAILDRLSVGPTLYSVNISDLHNAENGDEIESKAHLDYSTTHPLHTDFLNYGGASGGINNDLFTIQSKPGYGFIVPGTRTYAVLGGSAGHNPTDTPNPYVGEETDFANLNGTIFYKNHDASWTNDVGVRADGYSVWDHDDKGAFYWFYDLNEILDAENNYDPRPYARGHYNNFYSPPGIPSGIYNNVASGAWDEANSRLYLSLPYVERTYDGFSKNPVIVVLDFSQ